MTDHSYSAAVAYLARREHSAYELRFKLRNKGFDDAGIDSAIQRLQTQQLQSDQRYAQAVVRYRANSGQGPAKIRQALRLGGVDHALIEQALAQADHDWCGLAKALWQKKYGRNCSYSAKDYAKQRRFLLQRGFLVEQLSFLSDVSC